jgi:hypothetical protein
MNAGSLLARGGANLDPSFADLHAVRLILILLFLLITQSDPYIKFELEQDNAVFDKNMVRLNACEIADS